MNSYASYKRWQEWKEKLAAMADDSPEIAAVAAVVADVDSEVDIVDNHLHSYERWFGAAVTPDAEIHVADRIGTSVTAFQADAGDDDWGAWLQLLGSSDTPSAAGKALFDFHRIFISAVERSNYTHFLQIAYGADGDSALAAGNYTEIVYKPASAAAEETPVVIQGQRQAAGTKVWIRVFVPTQNTGTVDFWVGLHEYDA